METPDRSTIPQRVRNLEAWQEKWQPMLDRLAEDQAYRARWERERNSSHSRRRRAVAWMVATVGGLVVAAASVVSLIHALF